MLREGSPTRLRRMPKAAAPTAMAATLTAFFVVFLVTSRGSSNFSTASAACFAASAAASVAGRAVQRCILVGGATRAVQAARAKAYRSCRVAIAVGDAWLRQLCQ